MGWDPSFFRARPPIVAGPFPTEIGEADPAEPCDAAFATRLTSHVRAFDPALMTVSPLGRSAIAAPAELLRVRWTAPNGGSLEIVVTSDGWVHIDNHAGVDAICAVYRHLLQLDPRWVIFDPEDGTLHDESSLRRSLDERNAAFRSRLH